MDKQNSKIIINTSTEFKEKLKRKANDLGITLTSFVKMVLTSSLKGRLIEIK